MKHRYVFSDVRWRHLQCTRRQFKHIDVYKMQVHTHRRVQECSTQQAMTLSASSPTWAWTPQSPSSSRASSIAYRSLQVVYAVSCRSSGSAEIVCWSTPCWSFCWSMPGPWSSAGRPPSPPTLRTRTTGMHLRQSLAQIMHTAHQCQSCSTTFATCMLWRMTSPCHNGHPWTSPWTSWTSPWTSLDVPENKWTSKSRPAHHCTGMKNHVPGMSDQFLPIWEAPSPTQQNAIRFLRALRMESLCRKQEGCTCPDALEKSFLRRLLLTWKVLTGIQVPHQQSQVILERHYQWPVRDALFIHSERLLVLVRVALHRSAPPARRRRCCIRRRVLLFGLFISRPLRPRPPAEMGSHTLGCTTKNLA